MLSNNPLGVFDGWNWPITKYFRMFIFHDSLCMQHGNKSLNMCFAISEVHLILLDHHNGCLPETNMSKAICHSGSLELICHVKPSQ